MYWLLRLTFQHVARTPSSSGQPVCMQGLVWPTCNVLKMCIQNTWHVECHGWTKPASITEILYLLQSFSNVGFVNTIGLPWKQSCLNFLMSMRSSDSTLWNSLNLLCMWSAGATPTSAHRNNDRCNSVSWLDAPGFPRRHLALISWDPTALCTQIVS